MTAATSAGSRVPTPTATCWPPRPGAGNRTWRAYLSATVAGGRGAPPQAAVNARDRIGTGPWFNANGALIASNRDDLHMDRNNIGSQRRSTRTATRSTVWRPAEHARHPDGLGFHGRAATGAATVVTCNNWTSNAETDRTDRRHHDRLGGGSASWNATHSSAGCSQEKPGADGRQRASLLLRHRLDRLVPGHRPVGPVTGFFFPLVRGVVARIVTGPHEAHRQDPHWPMQYDTGRPRGGHPIQDLTAEDDLTPLPS